MSGDEETRDRAPVPPRRRRLGLAVFLAVLFLAALGLRLLYIGQIEDNVFFEAPQLDSANYHQKALEILEGKESEKGVLTYSPLYPAILSVLYRFMERPDFFIVRAVQAFIGALNCLLLFFLGRRFFDTRTALLAALAAVFYGPFLFFDGELIQSTWILFFVLLFFVLLPLDPERKGPVAAALSLFAGVLFGLALLGRPNMLPFLVFF